jgi:hypothetical protein
VSVCACVCLCLCLCLCLFLCGYHLKLVVRPAHAWFACVDLESPASRLEGEKQNFGKEKKKHELSAFAAHSVVYYESLKRELKTKTTYGYLFIWFYIFTKE